MTTLGKLQRVDLRDIWATEAQHFTPWLAGEENLKILADTVNMELELEAQEKTVGPFRADILCKNTDDGSWVLIENQLERTDHPHLGQLLTYGAGLHAVTIIWIAATFTDEHRTALDWLNEITDDSFRFFGLEVELWRIGDSPVAPKFNIVSKPNDWSRSITQAARRMSEEGLSETKLQQHRFWIALREFQLEHGSRIRGHTPAPQHWTNYGIGRTGIWLSATVNSREQRIAVELFIGTDDAKAFFHLLKAQQEQIEVEISWDLDWRELPERKGSRIILSKDNCDSTDEDDWDNQHAWLTQTIEQFDATFQPIVKTLNPNDWQPDTNEGDDE